MKYCSKCGKELFDEAVVCPECGCMVNSEGAHIGYCWKCGAPLKEGVPYCTSCGCAVKGEEPKKACDDPKKNRSLIKASIAFLILACVGCIISLIAGIYLVVLVGWVTKAIEYIATGASILWTLPMTIVYIHQTQNHKPVSLAFKVCTIIFASRVAGIIMLFAKEENA